MFTYGEDCLLEEDKEVFVTTFLVLVKGKSQVKTSTIYKFNTITEDAKARARRATE